MSPKYEEDLSSALGAICEVLTRENHLLFVGRIQEYDRAGGRLCAELRKGEGTPGGVLYHEPVKVHIYMGQEQGKVMIAYGQVERNAADHWWIELENVVSGPERRENFRQMVRGRGILTDREGRKQPCNLVELHTNIPELAVAFSDGGEDWVHQRGEILQSGPVYRGGSAGAVWISVEAGGGALYPALPGAEGGADRCRKGLVFLWVQLL